MAFKSKYTGSQIENLLDSVNNGELTLTENDIAGMGFTKNTGTITAIQANGTTVASSGTANIPAATTSVYGVTKLSTSTSSTSTSLAATASAVKSAYDLANGKQDKLVSGTNIKTINGQSLLGSGDITIEGGGSSEGGSSSYTEVNHGTSDTTFELTPNTFHIWDEVTVMNLTLGAETSGIANEYLFQFTSGSIPTTLTLPDDIKFSDDLVIEANKIYQISILKGLGSVLSWGNTDAIVLITFSIDGTTYQAEEGMTWEDWISSEYDTAGYIKSRSGNVIHAYTSDYLFLGSGSVKTTELIVKDGNYSFTNPYA